MTNGKIERPIRSTNNNLETLIASGKWKDQTPWEFFVSTKELDSNLCTAVFGIAIFEGKLLVVRHKLRGWELPGGHVDKGEKPEEALFREILEEAGAAIDNIRTFGYMKISPTEPISHRDHSGEFYPFPYSYIPYFLAEATEIFDTKLTEDVIEVRLATLNEVKDLFTENKTQQLMVEYLVGQGLISISKK